MCKFKQIVYWYRIFSIFSDQVFIKGKEYKKCFDQEFIELARGVYCTNDKRYLLKQKINILLDSRIIEEKSHTNYTHVFA